MVQLNAAQREAVEHAQGPLLVLAGAGSGKTRVITHRIARLVERGTRPESILAVSFTNKAAEEMAERMVPLVGPERAAKLWLSTFHSFGVRFLSEENRALGYDGRFVVFDQGDSLGLVRDIVRREGIGDRSLDLVAVLSRISLWKNAFRAPDEVVETDVEYDAVAREVYPHYERSLRAMHAADFDDLVVLPVRILRDHERIRAKWRARFRHLLVDEFQDTNRAQLESVRLLANELGNVCVVGDDDQSIYGWRGADVGNILDFERHFPGARVVKLEESYRSRAPILAVANAAIAQSSARRHAKTLRATRGDGPPVRLLALEDPVAEARTVVSEIRSLTHERFRLRDVAVLYRSNLQARILEEELRAGGVPHRVFGGTQFFDRKEVKDAIAYLRVAIHPRDELSLRRIVNEPPRGLGDTSLERIQAHAVRRGIGLFDALAEHDSIDGLPSAAREGARRLVESLRRASKTFGAGRLADSAHALLGEVGFLEALAASGKDGTRRRDNVEHLLGGVRRFETGASADRRSLAQYLTTVTLRFDQEEEDAGNRVTLSSLHSAKGLEFDVVFLIGCVEGQLPHGRTIDPKVSEAAPTDVDEERRLFYVGVTRARELLYLSRYRQRTQRGRVGPVTPSRFLDGLPDEMIEHYKTEGERAPSVEEAAGMADAILAQLRGGSD